MRRTIPVALAASVAVALLSTQPAFAYARTSGTAAMSQHVVAGRPLTAPNAPVTVGSKGDPTGAPATATVTNPDGFHRWVHSLTAAFVSSSKSNCTAADYQITSPTSPLHLTVAGNGTLSVPGVTVAVTSTNCNKSTVILSYTVG